MSTLVTSSIDNTGNSFHIKSGTANAKRVTLTTAGLVGVGTTSPDAALHVGGSLALNAATTVSGITTLTTASANGAIGSAAAPTSGNHLCNKTYVDSRVPAGCTIIFAQTAQTGTASLALTAGTWICECYGGYFNCAYPADYLRINGVTVTTFTAHADDSGCNYLPIFGQTKIKLLTPSTVVFGLYSAGTITLVTSANDIHMVCKATKVAS